MECWAHVTIMREIIKGRDSPVRRHDTRERNIKWNQSVEKQVSKEDQPPCVEEQSGSKVSILWR